MARRRHPRQWLGQRRQVLLPKRIDRLPIEVDLKEYLIVAASALLITVLATLYPAIAASR